MIPKSIDSKQFKSKFNHAFFLSEMNKLTLKFIRNSRGPKRPRRVKTTSKENEFGPFMPSYPIIYYKAALFQEMLYCHHSRQMDQWNRTKLKNRSANYMLAFAIGTHSLPLQG